MPCGLLAEILCGGKLSLTMKIVVTGAAGGIGSRLVSRLVNLPDTDLTLADDLSGGHKSNLHKEVVEAEVLKNSVGSYSKAQAELGWRPGVSVLSAIESYSASLEV